MHESLSRGRPMTRCLVGRGISRKSWTSRSHYRICATRCTLFHCKIRYLAIDWHIRFWCDKRRQRALILILTVYEKGEFSNCARVAPCDGIMLFLFPSHPNLPHHSYKISFSLSSHYGYELGKVSKIWSNHWVRSFSWFSSYSFVANKHILHNVLVQKSY